jgi:hypothetical protein
MIKALESPSYVTLERTKEIGYGDDYIDDVQGRSLEERNTRSGRANPTARSFHFDGSP